MGGIRFIDILLILIIIFNTRLLISCIKINYRNIKKLIEDLEEVNEILHKLDTFDKKKHK